MRKAYLAISFLLFFLSVNAQFKSGQKLLGPSLNIGFGSATSNINSLQASPPNQEKKQRDFNVGLGFTLLQMKTESVGWGWGINYNYTNSNTDETFIAPVSQASTAKANTYNFSVGYFRRKFYPLTRKFNFYYDAGINIGGGFSNEHASTTSYTTPVQITTTSIKQNNYSGGFYITPGLTYTIKKNLLLDAALNSLGSINYTYEKGQHYSNGFEDTKFTNSRFGLNSSLSASNLLSNFTFSLKWIL